jgi:osmoprotectant transport system substrate-binding protein
MVAIGDKNFTEQFILGQLYQLALSAQGFSTTLSQNIGTTSVTAQAMQDGTLDIYPEYLNVFDSDIAGYSNPFSTLSAAYTAGQSWAAGNGLVLLAPTPFSDTAGIAVSTEYASQHGLRSLYGLRRVATTLTLGAPLEFQSSPSGLPAIEQAYGFLPASVQSLNIGVQYQALSAGTVQAAYVNTTDGELSSPAYTLLGDPRHAFGFGNVVPVVTGAVIAAEGPAFASTINGVDALLTTSVMRQLNAEVDLDYETPGHVARDFLQDNGLLTASGS